MEGFANLRTSPCIISPMPQTKFTTLSFQSFIFDWWKKNKRDLPWRHTRNPYHILVSEVMLQQTQVSRVIPTYILFLRTFPTIHSLSQSSLSQILKLWKGMGYNRRALYLHQLSCIVVERYSGVIPDDFILLTKLPGLGIYTARALLVFAFNKNTYMVDTNIRKILTYFFFNNNPQKEKDIESLAEKLVPTGRSWEWHQALMDYGALELPSLLPKTKKMKPSIPFKSTDRYFRGRIIDELRLSSQSKKEFVLLLVSKYGKSAEYFEILLDKLSQEGLIVLQKTSRVSLPH